MQPYKKKKYKNQITLTKEQNKFIETALSGTNILVDACVGSGKTTSIQKLCNRFPANYNILYLTYNHLLKIDAQKKIKNDNVLVQNYHGYASTVLYKMGIRTSVTEIITEFNRVKPFIEHFNVLIIDEYQDINEELATLLEWIKENNKSIQIIAVGDMQQKIYDDTVLDAKEFIKEMLGNGAVESQVVLDTALNERQISKATLERAKSELKNVKSFQKDGKWFWKFKDDDTTSHNHISNNDNMDI